MRLFSYLSIIIGCMLVIVSAIWNLSGIMGYIITTIGVLLWLLGIFIRRIVKLSATLSLFFVKCF